MARAFTGYASAYSPSQGQTKHVRRQQVRTVTADFTGAMGSGQLIDSVRWDCTVPGITLMADAAVSANRRKSTVTVTFNYSGCGYLKATATLDDGTVLNYEFEFEVTWCPVYQSEQYVSPAGPYSLTVVA